MFFQENFLGNFLEILEIKEKRGLIFLGNFLEMIGFSIKKFLFFLGKYFFSRKNIKKKENVVF